VERELDVILPRGREMTIKGERLEIRPLSLVQLAQLEELVAPIAEALSYLPGVPEGEQLLEVTAGILKTFGDRLPRAVALACDRPLKWAALLTVEEIAAVSVAVLAQNKDFLLQGVTGTAESAPRGRGREIAWTLADSIQFLLSHGHRLEDVRNYTLSQVRQFLAAAVAARRRQLRDMAVAARAAQYDKQGFKQHLKEIERG
jgi:hypothetical protein